MRSADREQRSRCCCSPSIGQALFKQMAVIYEGVNGKQLDRRDPEGLHVVHDLFVARPL